MESTFSGMDMGPFKGMHITTQGLESLGRDLCRTVLVYTDLYIPPELQASLAGKTEGLSIQTNLATQ